MIIYDIKFILAQVTALTAWIFFVSSYHAKREKDSYIIIKYKNEIVGYINFLNVTEGTYNNAMESNELIDSYENEEIIPYHRNRKLYINMNSIVLKREYNNKKIVKDLGFKQVKK